MLHQKMQAESVWREARAKPIPGKHFQGSKTPDKVAPDKVTLGARGHQRVVLDLSTVSPMLFPVTIPSDKSSIDNSEVAKIRICTRTRRPIIRSINNLMLIRQVQRQRRNLILLQFISFRLLRVRFLKSRNLMHLVSRMAMWQEEIRVRNLQW